MDSSHAAHRPLRRRCGRRWSRCFRNAKARLAAVARQAQLARRACAHVAAARRRSFRSTNTTRRDSSAPTRRRTMSSQRRRVASAGSPTLRSAISEDRGTDGRGGGGHFRPAVHRALSGAVPVQPDRAGKPERRVVPAIVARRDGDRSRRQQLLRSHRVLRRQRVRLRFLQGLHRQGRRQGRATSVRCSAAITR